MLFNTGLVNYYKIYFFCIVFVKGYLAENKLGVAKSYRLIDKEYAICKRL